jgi:signal transduction histidine kinase
LPGSSRVILSGSSGFVFRYPGSDSQATSGLRETRGENQRSVRRQFTYGSQHFNLQMFTPEDDVRRTLTLLRVLLLSLTPVVILVACAGGAWLSGRALRPVNEIAAAALTISIENLSERLPTTPAGGEVAKLTDVLNSMLARLESAVKTLSQFAADASHELRTPLAVIRTTAELALRRERSPESYRDSLAHVEAEATRMTQLIQDLLALARGDSAASELLKNPLDVREILNEVCAELRTLAEKKAVQLKLLLGSDAAVVAGNRPALHRLFLILLDNALKYSQVGGDVIVIVGCDEAHVSVTVQDFGCGIPAEELPHIFKRFYRPAQRSAKVDEGEGYGLGLSLAAGIAQAHGARIHAESKVGAGSQFHMEFVRRDAKASFASQRNPGAAEAAESGIAKANRPQ